MGEWTTETNKRYANVSFALAYASIVTTNEELTRKQQENTGKIKKKQRKLES